MLIYWFIPMILFLGIVTSYEDIKFGKIRNKWLMFGIIYSIAIYFFLYFFYTAYNLNLIHLSFLLINGTLALTTGFLIWFFGLWTAGDAKLFFVYSLLLPLNLYRHNDFKFFPSANILINTFVPIALFLVIFVFVRSNNLFNFQYFKRLFSIKKLIELALFLFAFIWLVNLVLSYFLIYNYVVSFIFVFFLYPFFDKISTRNVFMLLIIVSIIRIIYDKEILLISNWIIFILLLITFIILRVFLPNASFNIFSKEVKVKDLKAGMIPAEIIYKRGNIFKKIKLNRYLPYHPPHKNRKYLFKFKPEGLNKDDISKIRNTKLPFEYIRVYETTGFALFMFIGIFITIFFNGNMFIVLKNLFFK